MNIFEHLEVVFSERRGEAKRRSSKFRKYASEEEKLYAKLKEGMTEEQQQQFEEYLIAVTATQAVVETLSYNLNSAKNYNEANDFRLNLP